MNSLFYFKTYSSSQDVAFFLPKNDKLRQCFSSFEFFELDNFSDASMQLYAEGFLEKSDNFVLWVDVEKEHSLGVLANLIRKLFRYKNSKKYLILLEGENEHLTKLLKAFDERLILRNPTSEETSTALKVFSDSKME